jgi:hypothetical protein
MGIEQIKPGQLFTVTVLLMPGDQVVDGLKILRQIRLRGFAGIEFFLQLRGYGRHFRNEISLVGVGGHDWRTRQGENQRGQKG